VKKILGFLGSPRLNGNTHVLMNEMLSTASSEGADIHILPLGGLVIGECLGCHACWKGRDCVLDDDMNDIIPRIVESDTIVFGTPVYWYGPTALMKGLIDRFVYFNCPENREKIRGKEAVIVVPFEENDPGAAELTVRFFETSLDYLEMNLVDKLIVPGVTRKGEVGEKREIVDKARLIGIEIGQ